MSLASYGRENRTSGGKVACWQIVSARRSVPYKSCKKWQGGEIIFNIHITGSHRPAECGTLVFESNVLGKNVPLCSLSDVELLGYQEHQESREQCTIVFNFEK